MAGNIREVPYYYVTSQDKPGTGAELMSTFREEGVNLLAVHAFPERGRVQVDIVPQDEKAFLKAARKVKLKLSTKKKTFLAEGPDRLGALAALLEKVSAAGINVTAVTALAAGKGRYGAILWVKPKDQRKTAKALGL